jgi:ribonuclease/clavin/mitogillin
MRFGANLFVFPGGSLEPGEAPRAAAAREAAEETGIVLDAGAFVPLTRWVTPPSLPIRYDTRFFGVIVGPGADVVRPSPEVVAWHWLRPTAALEAMASGHLAMWQPTVVTLQQLEPVSDRRTLEAAFDPAVEDGVVSGTASGPGVTGGRAFEHRWAGGIEGRLGRTLVVGERSWVVVDPGDPTGETAAAIVAAADAAGAELAGVVITDLDPAHHAGVEMFATGYGLPVAGPHGASGRVPYAVHELDDGAVIPFGDATIEARPTRLATAPASARWADRADRIRLTGIGH